MSFVKYRYLIFGILGAAYILVFFHRLAPAVVAVDMMTDLKTGGALMGILASAYFYPYGLMQIPAGLLSDSWGPRRSIIVLFSSLRAAGSIALGFAQTVGTAIAARVVVGLGVAMVFVPTLKILTHWFEPEKFVRMSGTSHVDGRRGCLHSVNTSGVDERCDCLARQHDRHRRI